MEYTCLIAGDASIRMDTLTRQLLLSPSAEYPLPAALCFGGGEEVVVVAAAAAAEEQRRQTAALGDSTPAGRTIILSNPLFPELDIRVSLHVAHTPAQESVAMCGTPELVLLVFSIVLEDSLQYLQKEWTEWLRDLNPAPSVILVGTQESSSSSRTAVAIEPGRIASIAKEMGAKAYFELARVNDSSKAAGVSELRLGIARACCGEFRAAEDLTEAAISHCRQRNAELSSLGSLSSPKSCTSSVLVPSSDTGPIIPSGRSAAASAVWGYRRHPRTNRLFYVNRLTKKSQYRRPPDYDGEEPQLSLEERVEVERERKEQLQRECELQHEHEELMRFNDALAEQQLRLKVKQSCARRLEHEVERLRLHAETLRHQRDSMSASRLQLSQLREEVQRKEQSFFQASMESHMKQQQELASVRRALEEEDEARGKEVEGAWVADSLPAAAAAAPPPPLLPHLTWGNVPREEMDVLHVKMQTTVDATRAAVLQLRDILERGAEQRERNAVVYADRLTTVRRTEELLLRTTATDAEEQRVRSALQVASAELMEVEAALAQGMMAKGARRRELCRHHRWAEAERQEEEILMHQLERLKAELAARNNLLPTAKLLGLEDAHSRVRLQRMRDVRECAGAHAMLASRMFSIVRARRSLQMLLKRLSDLKQQRVELLGEMREQYVKERLSMLERWYTLEACPQRSGSEVSQLHFLEERMGQLDASIERMQLHAAALEKDTDAHSAILQHANDVLRRSLPLEHIERYVEEGIVEECWMLLSGRLCRVMAHLKTALLAIHANDDDDDGGGGGVTEKGGRTAFAEHMARLQQDLWRCAAQSLLQYFPPLELRRAAQKLSRRHASGLRGASSDALVVDVCSSNPSDKAAGEAPLAWTEQLLLSVLSPAVDSRCLSECEALVQTEESVAAREDAKKGVLRRRLQQMYK